ncbi:YEATS domain-containing protein 2 [Belonocnema kinseyi]|uniref:YEATS domain-containing protein 2 n=1 Tax=Belonocnema kinseyi TaxID=2817044 RepID=UPI00143DEABF|nr:YEATS domain-containing protein 2 [Belonocnema kinseyi]
MNTSKDTLDDDQDPDYAGLVPNDQSQQQAFEENARANTARKINAIVEKEFSKEIDTKEKEVLQIQDRLDDALKTLHLLRYAIVTDFYNRKQCQVPEVGESKQTRIHPAVKRLIGKSPRVTRTQFINVAIPSTSKDPRFLDPETTPSTSKSGCEFSECENKNVNSEKNSKEQTAKRPHPDTSGREPPKKVPRYVPPKSAIPEPPCPSRGVHHKVRKRIVVGNISKWIPPDWREDAASHKWTMYVRGSKGDADIGDFVAKVRFFLHPSYRPNDVVEVTSPPFHLSRRGWGEFPLRVQLHFKNALNKPMDIIHHLKLDRTYTGLQTLGSETLVDVWIQVSEPRSLPEFIPDSSKSKKTDLIESIGVPAKKSDSTREIQQISRLDDSPLTNLNIKQEPDILEGEEEISHSKSYVLMDHDYCYTSSKYLIIENNKTIAHLPNGSTESTLKNGPISMLGNVKNQHLNGLENNSSEAHLNTNKINMQEFATTMKDSPGKMQPLKISIPQAFEAQTKKQFLVLKNKDVVPVNFDPKSKILLDSASIEKRVNDVSSKKQRQSGEIKSQMEKALHKNSEKSKLLKINASNSILLTANYSEPALKLADLSNPQNLGENIALENLRIKAETPNSFKSDSDYKDKSRLGKMKITLGKDKGKMNKKEIYEGVMRSIDDVRLSDTLGLVKFIMHRLPLVTEDASVPEYKRLHPYACKSVEEFLSYNIGKQRAYEWQRAKAVRSLLKKKVSEDELWSVKELIIWARRHAYTPISSITTAEQSSAKEAANPLKSGESILSTATEPVELNKWLSQSSKNVQGGNPGSESDEEIDVVSEEKPNENHRVNDVETSDEALILDLPPESESLFTFVNDTAREIGIKLTDEEIIPDVRHCAASHVIMRAVQCFVDDLIRLSHSRAIDRLGNKNRNVESINLEDVREALFNREEFDIFTNAGLGTQPSGED